MRADAGSDDACVPEDAIVDLIEGRLQGAARDRVTAHLDACDACRELVSAAARDPAGERAPLAPGARVGRYVIARPVGSGAMGTVYAAYDPELDREVALKLLRADALAAESAGDLGPRLRREAQALAKLSHPNVVAVHDVGTIAGELFVAMELVAGGTLGGWLAARRRSIEEIAAVFRHAGEGLAAAHEAGIVHRDFKPENVLIGDDGRVRVSDFGLAHAPAGARAPVIGEAASTATRTGALVGTPAYMAPEQWEGGPIDARTDVFSFCVALFEALYGERPFGGGDAAAMLEAMRAGRVVEPVGRRAPRWLGRIVRRGLAFDPAARWPGMRPLLDALAAGPMVTGPRVIAAAIAVAFVALAVHVYGRPRAAPCDGAEAAWGDVFGAAERAAAAGAFQRSGRPAQERAFSQVARAFDNYRDAWIAMRTDACRATRVRGEQSEALLDLRMTCLDDRRREAAALARLFAEADAELVDHASSALGGLGALEGCAHAKALVAAAPLPADPDRRRRIDDLSRALAEAKALDWTGKYQRALDTVRPAVAAARAVGYEPLLARLLYVQADAEHRQGALDAAEADLHAAAALALEARDDAIAADAWTLLVRLDGSLRNDAGAGGRWGRYAEAAIRRLGGDDEREATLLRSLATMPGRDDQGEERRRQLLRARALYEKSREPQRTFFLASVDEVLAAVLFYEGRAEEALAVYRRVEAARAELLGPAHLAVAIALANQADCLSMLGRFDEALALLRRALAATETPGAEDAYLRTRLADVLRRRGDPARALDEDRRARAAAEQHGSSVYLDAALTGEGLDLIALGRAVEAVSPLERAVAARERGAAAPSDLAEVRFALARALLASGGDRARAKKLAELARADIRPLAERHGSFYRASLADIERFLAELDARP